MIEQLTVVYVAALSSTQINVWCTACLGLAIGVGFLSMAFVSSVVMIAVLKLMQKIVIVPTYKN